MIGSVLYLGCRHEQCSTIHVLDLFIILWIFRSQQPLDQIMQTYIFSRSSELPDSIPEHIGDLGWLPGPQDGKWSKSDFSTCSILSEYLGGFKVPNVSVSIYYVFVMYLHTWITMGNVF